MRTSCSGPDALDEYAAGVAAGTSTSRPSTPPGAALLRSETTAAEVVAAFFTEE